MCARVRACAFERERERERVCVCVCVEDNNFSHYYFLTAVCVEDRSIRIKYRLVSLKLSLITE